LKWKNVPRICERVQKPLVWSILLCPTAFILLGVAQIFEDSWPDELYVHAMLTPVIILVLAIYCGFKTWHAILRCNEFLRIVHMPPPLDRLEGGWNNRYARAVRPMVDDLSDRIDELERRIKIEQRSLRRIDDYSGKSHQKRDDLIQLLALAKDERAHIITLAEYFWIDWQSAPKLEVEDIATPQNGSAKVLQF
jgi:hypothetical protein